MSTSSLTEKVDFIHSVSVLEHVPAPVAKPILENLLASLNPGGAMIHEIDLRDHLDMENAPLAFLAIGDDYDPQTDFDRRGNRLRRSDWLEIINSLRATRTSILYERQQRDEHIPSAVRPEFAARPSGDLYTSWMAVLTQRLD
jgi:SAM-dependent methyltransferase